MIDELDDLVLLDVIKKLWDVDKELIKIYEKARSPKSLQIMKMEKAKFDKVMSRLKKEVQSLQSVIPKIKSKELIEFSKRQLQFFQIALKVNLSVGKKTEDMNRNQYGKLRAQAYEDAVDVISDLTLQLVDELKKSSES